jgi:cytochrome b
MSSIPTSGQGERVRVWDPVVRLFHWGTAFAFAGAYFLLDPRDLHEALGYAVLALLAVRVIWGFVGTVHARFADFVLGPARFLDYATKMMAGREPRYLGHNPAGGAMVVALMALLGLTALSGWMMSLDAFWGEDWVENLHQSVANGMLVLIAIHVAGVAYSSLRHGENLVAAMFSGLKRR